MTDGQLLDQFVRLHDAAAFEMLVRRHGPMVMRVCQRLLRHVPDADDAFQATFIVLVRKAHSIIKLESVASWLYGVAYRIALRAKVRANRRLARERHIDQGSVPENAQASHEPGATDIRPVLDEELNRLPEKYRAPVVLCYLEGKTNEEAAQQLHCPTGTVKIRLLRARDMLRDRLGRRGLGLTAGAIALALAQEAASAAVPATLSAATAQTAALVAGGKASAVAASGATALADATIKAMMIVKVKAACAIAVAASLLTAGAAYVGAGRTHDGSPLQLHATLEHTDGVFAAAFAPDGQTIVTGGGDRIIRIWDAATAQELAKLTGHRHPIQSLAISPDGALLASGEGDLGGPSGDVKIWDLPRRRELASLPPHSQGAPSLAFAPNGKVLATASWRGVINLWDVASRESLAVLRTHTSGVARICFSPDGMLLASASNDRTVKLWETATGKELATLRGHTDVVHAVAFAPDGKSVASGSADKSVRIWDVITHEAKLVLQPGSAVHCVSFAPGSQVLLSGHTEKLNNSSEGVLKFWDVKGGALLDTVHVQKLQVGNAIFSPDGKHLLTTSWNRTAKLWDVNTRSKAWGPSR
ncbi:hypothetical protein AYO44_11495 [Planctomycetaceae bacterium SCGC AG-212-F19]|nr:hypothetical protein AYO44_11495 [Planctomycetaceae bacterium SCGC AG-212-F19]